MKLFPFFLLLLFTACATPGMTNNAAYDLELAKGRATSAAVETAAQRAANAVATNDARTQVAADHNSTRAAQAQKNALLYAQATNTAQSQFAIATSTAQYVIARGAETAQAEHARANATRTARASDATATADAHTWQTTATAARRTIEAEQAKAEATATAQIIALQIQQTQADAQANAERSHLTQSLLNLGIMVVGLIAACVISFVMVAGAMVFVRYINGRAARQFVIETRAGTILIQRGEDGRYFADLVQREPDAAPLFPVTDAPSQLPAITAQAETLTFTGPNGTRELTKTPPDDARVAGDRKLALELLRESLQFYGRKQTGVNPMVVNRIPTWHTLGWGAASWQRAIDLLRPYIETREGRGGGTFCVAPYPTVYQLYVAVGERRAALSSEDLSRAA